MKFKHTFHVFVDNFSTTYKLLLYRLIVFLCSACLYVAAILPFIIKIVDTSQFETLQNAFVLIGKGLNDLSLSTVSDGLLQIKPGLTELVQVITSRMGEFIWAIILVIAVYFVQRWFQGLGNYATGCVINDKMALHAESPFFRTLVKNLGNAALYNLIYVPLTILYDIICFIGVYALFFLLLDFLPWLMQIFLFVTVIIVLVSVKMTFTTNWLPSLIYGKSTNRKAIAYSFTRSGRNLLEVFSNMLVLTLVILAINVAAITFTFGAGFLITLPASYLMLIAFEFVNYCDGNKLKYFVDKNTIVRPEKERVPSREDFFRGNDL